MAEVLFLPLTSGSPESLPACQRLPALRPTEKIMRRSHHIDMLNGSLLDKILLFAMPLAASSILQQLFNSADMAVVGQFAGSQAMAAVGGNSAVINLLVNLFVGLSMGANVVIASYAGLKKLEKSQEAVHTTMALALISGIFLLFAGIFAARPILEMIDTPPDVLDLATDYLRLYFLGMPFIMVYNFGAAVLRSVGDTRRSLYTLIVAGVINVLLNLLLVIVFEMSVIGVGIATLVANAVSAGMIVRFLMREEEIIRFHPRRLMLKKDHLARIAKIGAPAGLQGIVFSLSNVLIQAAINGFGSSAIAGSATAINFEYFSYFFVSAFSQAAVTFTSQNYAACQFDRCDKVFRQTMACGLAATALSCVLFTCGAEFFTRLYIRQPEVVAYSVSRIWHVESLEWIVVFYEIAGSALRGMGISLLPSLITVAGSCVFRIIWLATIFAWSPTFETLMNVYPVSWVFMGIVTLLAYCLIRRRLFEDRRYTCVPEE